MKFRLFILLAPIFLLAVSCHNPDILPHNKHKFKSYTIKEGKHYCGHTIKTLDQNIIDFDAIFDESAMYYIGTYEIQSNINKLLGFTDCGSGVHSNSARFGWRWYNDRLEILAYCYRNGTRYEEYITSVGFHEVNNYKLVVDGNRYIFMVNEHTVTMPRDCSGSETRYFLYPYFGGEQAAPHDITVQIRLH